MISFFTVTKGQCADPSNDTVVYYYGHVMKLTDFKCKPGFKPVGPASFQCVLGNSSSDVKWSDLPTCKGEVIIGMFVSSYFVVVILYDFIK